ncbi:Receptor-like serine/threonine-protein kinase [Psidium guajava]|nr:Receptor-like serine/threonine-protein kinase [Psidium guajava]
MITTLTMDVGVGMALTVYRFVSIFLVIDGRRGGSIPHDFIDGGSSDDDGVAGGGAPEAGA